LSAARSILAVGAASAAFLAAASLATFALLVAASASAVLAAAIDFKICKCFAEPGDAEVSVSDDVTPTLNLGAWPLPDERSARGAARAASLRAGSGLKRAGWAMSRGRMSS